MNGCKNRCRTITVWEVIRPVMVGLLLSCAVTAALVALFSLVFVLLEAIVDSAVVPLALLSAAAGCFSGAFLCAALVRRKGIIFGVAVGVLMFLAVWVLGLVCAQEIFGTETAIKLLLLIAAGGAGGYLGTGYRSKRRK